MARNVVQRTEEDQGENEDDPPKVLAQTVRTAAGCALHYKHTKYQLQKNRCVFWPTFFFFPPFFILAFPLLAEIARLAELCHLLKNQGAGDFVA